MKNITYYQAGAGSGKTYTLTSKLSELLGKGIVKPSEVILTTFSEMAAGEFRERSRSQLYKDGHMDVANEMDAATIGTIHAVALNFIKRYWYLIGVSPEQKVISDDDLQIYISQSLGDYITPEHLNFFDSYRKYFNLCVNGKPDSFFWKNALIELIGKLHTYPTDIENSKKHSISVIDRLFSEHDIILDEYHINVFTDILAREINAYSQSARKVADPLLSALRHKEYTYDTLSILYKTLSSDDFNKIGKKNKAKVVTKMGTDNVQKLTDNLSKYMLSSNGQYSPGGRMKKMVLTLFDIAVNWKKGFEDFKKMHHIIDYNDMERLFLQLLDTTEVRQEIEGNYKLLMVDEFQDCSPIQLSIFLKLSDMMEHSYWVGDPKQSIYGFRGSDITLVNGIVDQLRDKYERNEGNICIETLNTSYRTRPSLVELTNDCFVRAFNNLLPSEEVKLNAHREEIPGLHHSLAHWVGDKNSFVDDVAYEVKRLLDSDLQVLSKENGRLRRIQAGDIAILCRSNMECADFANSLIQRGIPVSYVNGELQQQAEVHLVLTLLYFIVDCYNAHTKADLLRLMREESNTEDILNDRLSYLDGMGQDSNDNWLNEDPLIKKLLLFRQTVIGLSVSDLMSRLVYGLDLPNLVCCWGNAEFRRQNLNTICNLAVSYDEHCLQMGLGASISGFITYISYTKIDNFIDNSANSVKVLTYHKSKGLEWNYVILSSLDYDNMDDETFIKRNFWGIHELREEGMADGDTHYVIQYLPRILKEARTSYPEQIICKCLDEKSYDQLYKKEERELRHLLYVGVTRARDYLTTLERASSKSKYLSWISSAGISTGSTDENAKNLWGYDNLVPDYKTLESVDSSCIVTTSVYERAIYEDNENVSHEPKFLSPSTLPIINVPTENINIIKKFGRQINIIDNGTSMDAIGTCIHNIFAVCRFGTPEENIEKAQAIIDVSGLRRQIPNVREVIQSIDRLYSYLSEQYGVPVDILHEVPFVYSLNGQVIRGEIDLLWLLGDNTCVLVDFKNFPGKESELENPVSRHYAGMYAAQLNAYKKSLMAAKYEVRDTLVYYSVIGCVVRMDIS